MDTVHIGIRIPADLLAAIDKQAANEGRTRTSMILWMLSNRTPRKPKKGKSS